MQKGLKKGICLLSIAFLLLALALPVMAVAAEEMEIREFDGEAKVYERVKPDRPPGKPPKDDDDEEPTGPDLETYNKMAVVIGIADYRGRSNDLQYTDDDARDIYNYLISMNYPASNIRLLLDKQATATNIISAIDWMGQYENSNTECVFFYSGHGSQYSGGSDSSDPDGVDEALVSHDLYLILDDTLASKFSTYDTGKLAIMFDSCHSGGMDDLDTAGRVISAPCGPNEYSYDGTSTMQNGVWTYYLMTGLYTYDTVEGAHGYAASTAPAWIAGNYYATMTPVMCDSYTGDWQF